QQADQAARLKTLLDEQSRLTILVSLDKGLKLSEEGDVAAGMLCLARSLELAPRETDSFQHAVRANLAGWRRLLHPLRALMQHQQAIAPAAVSADDRVLMTGSWDAPAGLWDASTGRPVGDPLRHDGGVVAVVLSADGKVAMTGSEDRAGRVWDASTGEP